VFWEDPLHAIEEPVDLSLAAKKDPSQDEPEASFRVGLTIGKRQGRSPGPSENQPSFNPKLAAKRFNIRNQMVGCVVVDTSQRSGLPSTPLIMKDDSVPLWIEEAAVGRRCPGTWPPVQKQNREPFWVARFLKVENVARTDFKRSGLVWLQWRIKWSQASVGSHRLSLPFCLNGYYPFGKSGAAC